MLRPRTQGALRQSLFTSVFSPVFSSVFGGAGAAPTPVDAYAIGGASPELVAAFLTQADGATPGEYFRTGGVEDDFSMFTFSRSNNATMFDSTGTLVWAPHNELRYSEDLSIWSKSGASYTAETNTLASTGTSASSVYINCAVASPGIYKFYAHVEAGTADKVAVRPFGYDTGDDTCWFDLSSGTKLTEKAGVTGEITAVGDGSYICSVEVSAISDTAGTFYIYVASADNNYNTPIGASIKVYKAWVHRSDLSGMADNPDQPAGLEKYVPTTSAAVYLSRRNAYYYNGTAWTKGGLQLESAAATNLCADSQDLDGAGWTSSLSSVTDNAATGPDGNLSLQTLTDNSTGLLLQTYQTVTTVAGTTYTASFFVEKDSDETRFPEFFFYDGTNGKAFHLNTKTGATTLRTTVGTPTNNEIYVLDLDGFWFVYITLQVASTSTQIFIRPAGGTVFGTFSSNATGSINAGFVQFEAGSVPTSYIPTSGSTVPRPAETLSIAGGVPPWPTPQVIGSELVTNGGFDDASWWGADASWTISGGVATVTGNDQLYSPLSWAPSAAPVLISFDVTQVDTPGNLVVVATSPASQTVNITGTGTYTAVAYFNTTDRLRFGSGSGSIFRGSIDNVSVKEINPLAVSISMKGLMTYADENITNQEQFLRWRTDANNRIEIYLSTSVGTGFVGFQQASAGVADNVNSSTTAYAPGINVPFNIASRHGSTFVNGAVDGTALTANTTPTTLADLSATNLELGYTFNGFISEFRMWGTDIGDSGIAEVTS